MKKFLSLLCLLTAALFLLASCAGLPSLDRSGGKVINNKNGITYYYAPSTYRPISYSKDAVFTDGKDHSYRKVANSNGGFANTDELIYDYTSSSLLYSSEFSLPTLEQMNPEMIHFYYEDTVATLLHSDTDKNNISEIIKIYKSGISCKSPDATVGDIYTLTFTSEAFPFFAYALTYVEYTQDVLEYDSTASLEGYSFREGVAHTEEQNEDGSYTVTYNYGKYFLCDLESRLCTPAQFIHDTYNNTND